MTPEEKRTRAKSFLTDELIMEAFEDTKKYFLKRLLDEPDPDARNEHFHAYHAVEIARRKLESWPFN